MKSITSLINGILSDLANIKGTRTKESNIKRINDIREELDILELIIRNK